jgi:hypothetical protein
LHSHKFLDVKIYVPKSTHCHSICGLDIKCLSGDSQGYFAYESIVHAIETMLVWPQQSQKDNNIKGFLFLHDDILWKSNIVFNRPLIDQPYQSFSEWSWTNLEIGLPALDKFRNKYKKQEMQAYYGQSDFFYVPRDNAAQFAIIGRQMREMELFLEVAVPVIMCSEIMKATNFLKLYSPVKEKTIYHQEYNIAHPVKLSSMNGLLRHIDFEI